MRGRLSQSVAGQCRYLPRALFPVLALLLLAACAPGEVERPRAYTYPVEPGITFDLAQGRSLADDGLAERLAGARLIFLGEIHDEPRSHAFQAQVLRALIASGRAVTVALEMFPPAADEALRAWSAGEGDELEFLARSGWYDRWGYPWAVYRDLFLLFREHRLPLRGINATREERGAARKGELTPELAAELGALDLSVAPHRDFLLDALNGAGHGDGLAPDSPKFLAYRRVQALWDQVMGRRAARLARDLAAAEPVRGVVVVLIGSGHLAHGLGANLWAARAAPNLPRLTAIDLVAGAEDLRDGRYPLPVGIADLARIYEADPAPRKYPGLGGLILEEAAGDLRVTGLRLLGPSPLTAFRKGDAILSLNGAPLAGEPNRKAAALRLAYENLPPEGKARIRVRRDGETVDIELPLGGDGE